MPNYYDSKGEPINLYGPSTNFSQFQEKQFLKSLAQSNYHEITDAELNGQLLSFTFQLNGESYDGHALISQQFIAEDRLRRKAEVSDFNQVSIFTKRNRVRFNFNLHSNENKDINLIFSEVLRIINNDGDINNFSRNQPPSKPLPSSDHKPQETSRENNRLLHFTLNA